MCNPKLNPATAFNFFDACVRWSYCCHQLDSEKWFLDVHSFHSPVASHGSALGNAVYYMWDTLTVGLYLQPSLCSWEQMPLQGHISGREQGHISRLENTDFDSQKLVNVAKVTDVPAFVEFLLSLFNEVPWRAEVRTSNHLFEAVLLHGSNALQWMLEDAGSWFTSTSGIEDLCAPAIRNGKRTSWSWRPKDRAGPIRLHSSLALWFLQQILPWESMRCFHLLL